MAGKREKCQTTIFLLAFIVLFIASIIACVVRAKRMQKVEYADHMEDVAVTVDGESYTFRDIAFYLAYKEQTTQKQAKVYDLEHTNEFWNLHTNGSFIRIEAKDTAMDMAVHDVIFYRMAEEEELSLSEDEKQYVENKADDFWNDLEEEGQKRLGVSKGEIDDTFIHMGLAQKAQQLLADTNGVDYREYNVEGSMYQDVLDEHTYKINEKLWKRLDFGNIILD